jgi:hypothetical protein
MTKDQKEREARRTLGRFGLRVEAVAWIRRGDEDEFAAIVCPREAGFERIYDRALEVLTDPRCPLVVAREHVGREDIRIYVAFPKAA